ncbi:MAG TPA: energy transducer TonB [Vicinamibacterales bacterium]|nr:energy transducer TonB [Vicinamibacterales bacterium]
MAVTSHAHGVEVYSVDEIAQAAGVPVSRVKSLLAAGHVHSLAVNPGYFAADEAVAAVRALRADGGRGATLLFDTPEFAHTSVKMPVAAASAVHAGIAASLILISTIGLPQAAENPVRLEPVATRLVFIASPGPGGGGGGGGLKQKAPPPRAQRKGKSSLDSPVPVRKAPKPIEAAPKPEPPPPPPVTPEPLPPVVAPVATVAANDVDRAGVIDEPAPKQSDSRGPGAGGGAGSGTGTGVGKGDGSGIGEGSGGGMGGGPYRPGSGVLPPRLLREVKAGYTEEARRANVEGEVVLEIVVRRDGSVSDVKLVSGLSRGLNERAIAAVRQWRFAPATRLGQAVDVVVEVAVEFKLR